MVSNAVLLFLVIDPFGLIPIYIAMMSRVAPEGSAEPFIVPLATPLFAGPSALTLVMLIGNEPQGAWLDVEMLLSGLAEYFGAAGARV